MKNNMIKKELDALLERSDEIRSGGDHRSPY